MLIFAFYTVFFASVFNSKKCHLFSDAEVFEDVGEDGVGGDFAASDFGKVVEALAEIFGNKVTGDVVGYGMTDTGNGFKGMVEGFVMTEVGDDGGVVALIDGKDPVGGIYQGAK